MNRIALAATIAALGSAASAQQGNFSYVGEIVSIQDDLAIFNESNLGDIVNGVFAFNLNATPFIDIPSFLVVLPGESISANFANTSFVANDPENILVLVANDLNSASDPNPNDASELFDSLIVGSPLPNLANTTYGSVAAFFEGETGWFEGTSLPDIGTFGLENLLRAEVVIEFQFVEGFDPDTFNPNEPLPDGVTVVRSTAVIRINSIANNDGTIATIGCQALQFASPVAQRDFFDVAEFLSRYSEQDASADMAAPFGTFNFFDVSEFLTQFSTSCTN